jgi:hypothetical protein
MLFLVAALAVAAFAGDDKKAATQGQPDAAQMQAMMTAMAPGGNHAHLAKLAGNHTYTMKMWMDPAAPPQESTGKRSAQMILGGRFLEEKYSGNFMGMPFEGIGWMGYDNLKKEYTGAWIDNMGTGIMDMSGTGSADGKTWTMKGTGMDPATGKPMTTRSEINIVDDNTFTMTMFGPGADGKETKMFEMTCKKAAM